MKINALISGVQEETSVEGQLELNAISKRIIEALRELMLAIDAHPATAKIYITTSAFGESSLTIEINNPDFPAEDIDSELLGAAAQEIFDKNKVEFSVEHVKVRAGQFRKAFGSMLREHYIFMLVKPSPHLSWLLRTEHTYIEMSVRSIGDRRIK